VNLNCRHRFVNGQTTASSFLFLLAYRTYAKRNGVARTHACHVGEMTRNLKGARCLSRQQCPPRSNSDGSLWIRGQGWQRPEPRLRAKFRDIRDERAMRFFNLCDVESSAS
jgi:hypothetical protein